MRGAHSVGQKSPSHFLSRERPNAGNGGVNGGHGGGGGGGSAGGSAGGGGADDVVMSSSRRVADFDMKILQQKKQEAEVKRFK